MFRLGDMVMYRKEKKKWSPQMLAEVSEWYRVHKEELVEAWETLHGN